MIGGQPIDVRFCGDLAPGLPPGRLTVQNYGRRSDNGGTGEQPSTSFRLTALLLLWIPERWEQGHNNILAEGVGFEPTVPLQARRFSRPVP